MIKAAPVYLDHHATTPLDPKALRAMMPYLTHDYANASNTTHAMGVRARRAVEAARLRVAQLLGAEAREIIFTSGATESNNLALKGIARALQKKGNHLITTRIEHKSVLDVMKRLEMEDFRVTYLPVDARGFVNPSAVEAAVTTRTILISVIWAHNEFGAIQPMEAIARVARKNNILFHSDASQAAGRIPVSVHRTGADLVSVSSHKLYGPKGVGALFLNKKTNTVLPMPQIEGGAQESGMRAGTLNVPGIVGFGEAARLGRLRMVRDIQTQKRLSRAFLGRLKSCVKNLRLNGPKKDRLPGNLNIFFPGVPSKKLLGCTPGVVFSAGSACLSSSPEPSYSLKELGLTLEERECSVRFGFGRGQSKADILKAADRIAASVRSIQKRTFYT